MPSFSSLPIPNIGTANLTAILATSSLYAYLLALHHHQQKTLLKDQEARERERGKLQVQAVQETRIRNPGGEYREEQRRSTKRDTQDQERFQYRTIPNSDPYTNTKINTDRTTTITPRNKMSKTFSPSEVAAHKDVENGMYIIIDEGVYDVASFLEEHPGGAKILKRVAGKDASKQFWKYHNEGVLKKYGEKLKIGTVGEKAKL